MTPYLKGDTFKKPSFLVSKSMLDFGGGYYVQKKYIVFWLEESIPGLRVLKETEKIHPKIVKTFFIVRVILSGVVETFVCIF